MSSRTLFQHFNRAYESSKLYRDLKLRGSIIKDGEVVLLPKEEVFCRVPGVLNLSSEQACSELKIQLHPLNPLRLNYLWNDVIFCRVTFDLVDHRAISVHLFSQACALFGSQT